MFEEYARTDAVELAARVRAGELRAEDLLEAAIARAEALNPRLNAIVWKLYDHARRQARAPLSGPLAGVPFLVKDLFRKSPASRSAGATARCATPACAPPAIARWWRAGGAPDC
jgi:Asp-tRNAAsn/Glu-tRNAGln amidotransferase A subunit and related amidases